MKNVSIDCRLCGQKSFFRYSRRDVDGDEISSFECSSCRSLQTQLPYWLEQVYAPPSPSSPPDLDTWAAERTVNCRKAVYLLWKLGGKMKTVDKLLDWGGGPGLLVRMLRDVGIDAYNHDKYVKNHFASGFERSVGEHYKFVTAFEVFEHFAQPSSDIDQVFSLQPELLLISTGIYTDQGPDWTYLGGAKSQHIFFYSKTALKFIGEKYGYHVTFLPNEMTLFSRRPIAGFRMALISYLLGKRRLSDVLFALKKKYSLAGKDNAMIRAMHEARRNASGSPH
jgi:hypothetical protein